MNNKYCTLTKQTFELKEGTKSAYKLIKTNTKEIDQEEYNNICCDNALRFFRRLGGSEYVERCYTSKGYNVYRLTSKSPDRQTKIVRTFEF